MQASFPGAGRSVGAQSAGRGQRPGETTRDQRPGAPETSRAGGAAELETRGRGCNPANRADVPGHLARDAAAERVAGRGAAQEAGGTERPGPTDVEEASALRGEQKAGESERGREGPGEPGLGERKAGRPRPSPEGGRTPGAGIRAAGPFSGSRLRRCGAGGRREGCGRQQDPRAGRTGLGGRTLGILMGTQSLQLCHRVKNSSINIC